MSTMTRRRRGVTFVELMVVLAFIGLLARLAVPRYGDMKRRAQAASIVGDMHTLRVASFAFYTENRTWPGDASAGVVPAELVTYLPDQFSFTRPDWTYDFERWTLSDGDEVVGVTVTTNDHNLVNAVVNIAGRGYGPFVNGNKVTFLFTGITIG